MGECGSLLDRGGEVERSTMISEKYAGFEVLFLCWLICMPYPLCTFRSVYMHTPHICIYFYLLIKKQFRILHSF